MDIRQNFITEIEAFLARTGMSGRRFSVEATGDAGFWSRISKGADVTTRTIERVRKRMREIDESGSEKR